MAEPLTHYGAARIATVLRDFDRLREAIRNHEPEATEEAWLACERWLDLVYAVAGRERSNRRAGGSS